MKFQPTPLKGAYIIEQEPRTDARGFFARGFCSQEFERAGLETRFVQINDALSRQMGTVRGMHYQLGDAAEVKMVRCIQGSLYDVILDLRPDSPTFGQSFGAELSAENRKMMYVPRGFAHGLITLQNDTEAFYLVSQYYSPENERGVRWNDPRFNLQWPIAAKEISEKDGKWPDFDPVFHGTEMLRGML